LAAPEEGQRAAHAKGPEEGEAERLEKESVGLFGPWALDTAVWTVVVFLVLLFILGRFAWKPMLEGLEHRERAIREASQEAQQARDEAVRLRQQLQEEMDRAHERVGNLLADAERNAQKVREQMTGEARKEIQAERERLHRELESARDQALQQIWSQAAHLATLVSAKAIGRQLTLDDHRHLVDEALAELSQAGNERQRANGRGGVQS